MSHEDSFYKVFSENHIKGEAFVDALGISYARLLDAGIAPENLDKTRGFIDVPMRNDVESEDWQYDPLDYPYRYPTGDFLNRGDGNIESILSPTDDHKKWELLLPDGDVVLLDERLEELGEPGIDERIVQIGYDANCDPRLQVAKAGKENSIIALQASIADVDMFQQSLAYPGNMAGDIARIPQTKGTLLDCYVLLLTPKQAEAITATEPYYDLVEIDKVTLIESGLTGKGLGFAGNKTNAFYAPEGSPIVVKGRYAKGRAGLAVMDSVDIFQDLLNDTRYHLQDYVTSPRGLSNAIRFEHYLKKQGVIEKAVLHDTVNGLLPRTGYHGAEGFDEFDSAKTPVAKYTLAEQFAS